MNDIIKQLLDALAHIGMRAHNMVAVRDCSLTALETAQASLDVLGKSIGYPEKWDTVAYPTLSDALDDINDCAMTILKGGVIAVPGLRAMSHQTSGSCAAVLLLFKDLDSSFKFMRQYAPLGEKK